MPRIGWILLIIAFVLALFCHWLVSAGYTHERIYGIVLLIPLLIFELYLKVR